MNAGEDDLLRLRHMLDAAQEVTSFTEGAAREDLDTNLMLLRALSMSTGIIGEAASHLSQEFRDAHPEVPWRQIVAMRNFLFHVYFRIDNNVLWNTAVHAIPALIVQLEAILQDE